MRLIKPIAFAIAISLVMLIGVCEAMLTHLLEGVILRAHRRSL